jgi:hypothetical protein
MRTTVNISDDLLAEARVVAARTRRSLGDVVDDALRLLFGQERRPPTRTKWTFPTDGDGGLQPGVNLADKHALAELLGDNALP